MMPPQVIRAGCSRPVEEIGRLVALRNQQAKLRRKIAKLTHGTEKRIAQMGGAI